MVRPLVDTKLYIPQLRRSLVPRPRLSDRLNRGAESKLTLVSAPAGFGKTTVLAAWLAQSSLEDRSTAWVSLDAGDSRPASFWTYVVTALEAAVPGVGAGVLPLLQSARPPIETVLATVLNELGALRGELDLVLDDYHLVDGPDIAAGMTFLLEHLPPHVHVVISTRADPDLPLPRLRARGDLVEIRAADLRFTPEEVSAYLTEVAGLDLAARDIAVLDGRTEGWIAALQLAALSMQGRQDVAGFISGFAGDDRYIVDYLVEEVLGRQPDHVRDFLLRTSILDRLSGPLCDAVTGQHDGRATLEALDRANLFVVPLDDHRRWYRYHHLFADVLRAHLADERPDEIRELHRRASRWHEANAEPLPAVRHAMASGDVARAADLVELAMPALRRDRQDATIRAWVDTIPDDVVRTRPVLAVGFVGALMTSGEFDGVEARLQDVERLLDQPRGDPQGSRSPSGAPVVVDRRELSRLPGVIAMYRAALALVGGNAAATVEHADLAIRRAPQDDLLTRAGASALSGLARWGAGDLEGAHRAYSLAADGLHRAGHLSDVLACSITLADIRITQGRLTEALHTYQHALRLGSEHDGTVLRGTADMYVGLSQIARERGDLPAARSHLQRGRQLGEHIGLPQNPYRWRVATARILEAEGDLAGALELLDEAERVYTGDFSPAVRPIAALRARVLVAQGDLGDALAWVHEQGLSPHDDLSYLHEYEHLTLAKILLAQSTAQRSEPALHDARGLLERLLVAAEEGGRAGSVLEILVLQALAGYAGGDVPAALTALERALTMAEPEGYVQVFAGEGAPMAALLRALAKRRTPWPYVRRLLEACERAGGTTSFPPSTSPAPTAGADRAAPARGPVEPLSERELEVLRMLATDLDGPGIARHLVVSVNTVRTHTRNVYAKLGVNSRRAAVRRAGELDLLRGDRHT